MAIVKSKDGKYYNIDDGTLAKFEVDVMDLPEGTEFDDLGAAELDKVAGGSGRYRKAVAVGVRG